MKRWHMACGAALAGALLTAGEARADELYALGVFHFNIQYVAGGMIGYWSTPNPALDLNAEQIEDLIVTQSFEPVLELYQKHPTWGVDIELQGYFLDVLAARHTDTLNLLRTLAKSGQIDVLSWHYSDQFFIAHPYDDWSRSQARTAATFARYDIPLGTSVFCQEGQGGEVMAKEMQARGYATMIWPKNLWTYQHGDFMPSPDPLYAFGDVGLVVGGQAVDVMSNGTHLGVQWTYMDDGELMATGGIDPYFPDIFKTSATAVSSYESGVAALEAQGYKISTVSKYHAAIAALVTPSAPPPLIDGTWQPGSTDSSHRWLGGGGLWAIDERDNHVQTLADLAHRELAAASAIAAEAGLDAKAELDDADRLLSLGEGSDAEGVNPFRGEVEYGIGHLAEVLRIARGVIRDAKTRMGLGAVTIDPASGSVMPGASDDGLGGKPGAALFDLAPDGQDRTAAVTWLDVSPGLHRVEVAWDDGDTRTLSVTFPGATDDALVTTRALDDAAPYTYQRSAFTFTDIYLTLPMGVVGLGGGRFVIEDQARVHLAAHVFRDKGDVVFADETQTAGEAVTWVFYVFDGSAADAVALARRINDERQVSR